ncbi:unnamed protein product [Euphydryas editha]|uniref:Uncharacterized protein n=1 Tax=Euphydryas editha TaxID=104508 RepID=A0AAU9TI31_EUPED|nr:unnamed protein product [Euphydryas editha]
MPRKKIYDTVYSSGESLDEDQPLATLKTKNQTDQTAVCVKVRSERKIQYTYAKVAKSTVDEEGDVLIMFLKTVDDSGRLFKLVENDVSDVPFDDLLKILPAPNVIKKGNRQYFQFEEPLSVFEK